ncbi:hypothetical protein [Streptomyces sp. GbtcB7]|uniref:hypothetical protein n=1 Tax=Streptomyces sp. GbtcB7 TaxID=2824752 RepID=UPI001C30F5F0|nr:hypothetical protein [Streptomyces sp. GbtcB7]
MHLIFYSSESWQSWGLGAKPLIPEGMPVLIDADRRPRSRRLMGRITDEERARNEQAIRAAMDRVLSGQLRPGRRCDLKTLAQEAGVPRTGFYPRKTPDGSVRPGPYQHLAREFQRRVDAQQRAGTIADPRAAQIERLKRVIESLKMRLAAQEATIAELTEFKTLAIGRIAAQQAEIEHLRSQTSNEPRMLHLVTPHGPSPS